MPRTTGSTAQLNLGYFPGDIGSDQIIDTLLKYYVMDGDIATAVETVRLFGEECARPSVSPAGIALEFSGRNGSSVSFDIDPGGGKAITLGVYLRIVDSYSLAQLSTAIVQVISQLLCHPKH